MNLDMHAPEALETLAGHGVSVALHKDGVNLTVRGLKAAPAECREYLLERKAEVVWYLLRQDDQAYAAWARVARVNYPPVVSENEG